MSPEGARELNGSRRTVTFLYDPFFVRSEIQPDKKRDRLFGWILRGNEGRPG